MTKIMQDCQREYKETPIDSNDVCLKNFYNALKTRGFNFDPFKIIKEIDAEAESQFKKLFKEMFNGLKPDRLVDIKNEIIKWYNEEEVRFETFRLNYIETMKGPIPVPEEPVSGVALAAQVEEENKVLPIKKKGKR